MGHVRSRKFCCCLPVRFGVFCMSLLGFAGGLLFSVCGWIEVHKYFAGTLELSTHERLSLWLISLAFTWFTLVSVVGLCGSVSGKFACVQFYAVTVTANTVLIIAVGIYFVWTLFHGREESDVSKCVGNATGDVGSVTSWVCQKGFDVLRIIVLVILILIWLLQIAGIFIVFDYVGQLREEREAEYAPDNRSSMSSIPQKGSLMRTTYDVAPYDPYASAEYKA